MTMTKVRKPGIVCPKCKHRTTKKMLEEKGMCSPCHRLEQLEPFDRAVIGKILRQMRGVEGMRWEGGSSCMSEIKKRFRPPPGAAEWKIWHLIDIDGDRLNW